MTATDLAAFDAAQCGLLGFADDGRVVAANHALLSMLGRLRDEVHGQPIRALLTPASNLFYQTYFFPTLRLQGSIDEAYLTLKAADGGEVPVLVNAVRRPAAHDAQSIVNDCVLMRMRERKRIEDELLRIKKSVERMPGVLYQLRRHVDGSLALTYASTPVRDLLGVAPAALRDDAAPALQAIHRDDRGRVLEALSESARRMTDWHAVYRVEVPGRGERWIEAQASPEALADGGVQWHGHLNDVTERRATEQQARDAEEARRASRAKTEFLTRLSHELRTPLNAILGFAQLLQVDPTEPPSQRQRERIATIERAGRGLLHLVDEVLCISAIEAGKVAVERAPVQLAPLVEEAVALVQPLAAEAGVTIERAIAADLAVVGDARRLREVLLNLLSNAIKYGSRPGCVRVQGDVDAAMVRIDIDDDGPGLSDAQIAQLFQPFERLDAETRQIAGSGLGLVIVRRLVELMGGTVSVGRAASQGARFSLHLPRHSAGTALPAPTAAPGTRSVLYVEADRFSAALMASLFRLSPTDRLRIATNVDEAIALADEEAPDLLLVSAGDPQFDAASMLSILREHPSTAQVPAIAVADGAGDAVAAQLRAAGFDGCWTRPLQTLDLLREMD
jgi:signal transduction histidine kinase